jgi:predicted nuclease of predicted toxin-antitoxin system
MAAIHVESVGLLRAHDNDIFDYAAEQAMVVVTSDSDFAMLLALRRSSSPSVVLMRGVAHLPPSELVDLLSMNLPSVVEHLDAGAIVSLSPKGLRWRQLPIL